MPYPPLLTLPDLTLRPLIPYTIYHITHRSTDPQIHTPPPQAPPTRAQTPALAHAHAHATPETRARVRVRVRVQANGVDPQIPQDLGPWNSAYTIFHIPYPIPYPVPYTVYRAAYSVQRAASDYMYQRTRCPGPRSRYHVSDVRFMFFWDGMMG